MILRQQPHCILCLWLYIINTFCLFHPFSTTNKHFDRTCLILIIRPLDTSLETLQMLHCRIGKPHNGQDSWGRLNHTHGKRRFKKSTTADSGVEDDRTKKLILMCFVLYMFLLFFPQVTGDKIDTTKRLTNTYSCSLFFHVWCCVPKSSGSHRSQNKSRHALTRLQWNHRAADTCSRRSGPSRRVTRIHRVKLR